MSWPAPWTHLAAAAQRWARQLREPLFLLAASAACGILLADHWPAALPWLAAALLSAAAAAARRHPFWIHAATCCCFALAHTLQLQDPLRLRTAQTLPPGGSLPAQLCGLVLDAPVPSLSGDSWQFPLRVESLAANGLPWPASRALLHVRLSRAPSPPSYGDRLALDGLLHRPEPLRNPGEFDFDAFLQRQNIAAEFTAAASPTTFQTLARNQGNPLIAAALHARDWIAATVTRDLEDSPDIAATVRTMVLGTREKTPDDITDAFRASGTMHIFSVSGLHVALFAALLWFTLSRTPLPRSAIVALSLAIMFFYVFITGLRPSAWRAALMVGLLLLAPLANRETNLFNSLGAAALLLLGWQSQQLFQPGFVLSFGVLLAIALFQKPLEHLASAALGSWNAPDPFLPEELRSPSQSAWYWLREKLCLSLGVSTASTLGSMPLMIGYFNLITPVGILANLILVTLSLWILVIACLSLVSAALGLTPLLLLWNNANWALAWASIATAKGFAALPLGHLRVDPARLWRGHPCELTLLDLDRGAAAAHLDTPTGHHWLIDCGGLKHWNRTLRPHLERTPINTLDGLILTHQDADHRSALAPLTSLFPPQTLYASSSEKRPLGSSLHAGQSLQLEPDLQLEVLWPPPRAAPALADDRALVLRLTHRHFRILLTSDSGFLTEKSLLASDANLRADVLVMGRHSADFSGLPEFLRAVQPRALVFSNHPFPAAERAPTAWIQKVADLGITPFDQSRCGAVQLRIDRDGLRLQGFLRDSPSLLLPSALANPLPNPITSSP